jgi:hypothetical protein
VLVKTGVKSVKNCLAAFGLLFLLVMAGSAVLFAPVFLPELTDFGRSLGILDRFAGPDEVITGVVAGAAESQEIRSASLVEAAPPPSPTPTLIPTPTPTPTPVPIPAEYKARVMIRIRHFSTSLDIFMDANQKLDGEASLLSDPTWRSEVAIALDEFVAAAAAMGGIDSVPEEYREVDQWLDRAGAEARTLREHYLAGVETGNMQYFEAAAGSLNQIIEFMAQAQRAMIASGWDT